MRGSRDSSDAKGGDVARLPDPLRDAGSKSCLPPGTLGGTVQVLRPFPCHVTWVGASQFPAAIPATSLSRQSPEAEVAAASQGAYFLVMTHSHPLDQALETILQRGEFHTSA
jgi:xanthine/CO dehydrogenase XdhC/CoxF family maturation factor